jgi:hypothetical protein
MNPAAIPEPSTLAIPLTFGAILCVLIAIYFFGVWLRTYVLPTDNHFPVQRQLLAAIPVGFITMGLYAKSAVPPLLSAHYDVSADAAIMVGYAIVLGMMSRETLEKMMSTVRPPQLPGGAGG